MTKWIAFLLAALVSGTSLANTEGPMQASNANIRDRGSLLHGAQLFMNYCVSCHSIELMRYSRIAKDLGLTEEQVQKNLNLTGGKFGEPIRAAMRPADAEAFFGKAPPDLSLTARAKPGNADWIYTYLKSFYVDESRPAGWNNTVLVGASMPNVLWELQGLQRPVYGEAHDGGAAPVERLELASPGKLSPEEYDIAVRDIANFMQYVAEPAAFQRTSVGVWVILFLSVFTFLAWLLKTEYWRDVH